MTDRGDLGTDKKNIYNARGRDRRKVAQVDGKQTLEQAKALKDLEGQHIDDIQVFDAVHPNDKKNHRYIKLVSADRFVLSLESTDGINYHVSVDGENYIDDAVFFTLKGLKEQ